MQGTIMAPCLIWNHTLIFALIMYLLDCIRLSPTAHLKGDPYPKTVMHSVLAGSNRRRRWSMHFGYDTNRDAYLRRLSPRRKVFRGSEVSASGGRPRLHHRQRRRRGRRAPRTPLRARGWGSARRRGGHPPGQVPRRGG